MMNIAFYDDLNTSSSYCTDNVNEPAYVSADSGPIPVSPETYNVTQDDISDLAHDSTLKSPASVIKRISAEQY